MDLIVVTHEGREAGQKNVANDSKRPHVCNVDSIVMILMMMVVIMVVMMMMMIVIRSSLQFNPAPIVVFAI